MRVIVAAVQRRDRPNTGTLPMPEKNEAKRLERRARMMIMNKVIPKSKMELVRSIMKNDGILAEERFRAVIELLQNCPDRSAQRAASPKKTALSKEKTGTPASVDSGRAGLTASVEQNPSDDPRFINAICRTYKPLRLFRKRYLIHANNRLGFWIKKRLVPTRRLTRLLGEVYALQGQIMARLPEIMTAILRDQSVQSPTVFNYLRIFIGWMNHTPLSNLAYESVRWMDRRDFEAEFKPYLIMYFSFQKIDTEVREQIILEVENRLRMLPDLAKEAIDEQDPLAERAEKEKRNLAREKSVYAFMMAVRSFLSAGPGVETTLSAHLANRYGVQSLEVLLLIIAEALMFRRTIDRSDIVSAWSITTVSVSTELWDYSLDFLKSIGKDPETRIKHRIETLKEELVPYDEIYNLLRVREGGKPLLESVFEYQWIHVDKKRGDFGSMYQNDFLGFLNYTLTFFNTFMVPLFSGAPISFEDKKGTLLDGALFHPSYFQTEVTGIAEILNEMHYFKTNNPKLMLSRDEVANVLSGKIKSMAHIDRFLSRIGSLFFSLARELHRLLGLHREWVAHGGKLRDPDDVRTPRDSRESDPWYVESGQPLPFHDCKIKGIKDGVREYYAAQRNVLTLTAGDGVYVQLLALCYQIAYECMDEELAQELRVRTELIRTIKELSGQI